MDTSGERADPADETWTTPQVAEFLGISRQAINKRVRNRKMLGYAGSGSTLFPVWQFDIENKEIREEIPEFLAAFPEDVEPKMIANWAVTGIGESGRFQSWPSDPTDAGKRGRAQTVGCHHGHRDSGRVGSS